MNYPSTFPKNLSPLRSRRSCWLGAYRLLTAIWGFISCNLYATPPDSIALAFTIPTPVHFATADNLGQVYCITADNAIEKYAPDGKLLTRYSNRRYGDALYLDVSNPLKVLVWYADFRIAVLLDRNLALLGALDLIGAGFPEVRCVATAADGNLWLYDEVNFRLVKIAPDGEKRYESQPLNQIVATTLHLTCLRDDNTRVWASDPDIGFLEFDGYAQYQRTIPEQGVAVFQMDQNRFDWIQSPWHYTRSLRDWAAQRVALPAIFQADDTLNVWSAGPILLRAVRGQGLEVYKQAP